jgi:hydrogenase maturation protease
VKRVRIVGIGSPFGEDRLGWEAIAALEAAGLADNGEVELQRLDRPGPALIASLTDAEHVVLIDALKTSETGAPVRRVEPRALAGCGCASWSGHGLGVAESLELASTLGLTPPKLDVLGIVVPGGDCHSHLPEETRAALVALVQRLTASQRVGAHA